MLRSPLPGGAFRAAYRLDSILETGHSRVSPRNLVLHLCFHFCSRATVADFDRAYSSLRMSVIRIFRDPRPASL